MGQASGGGVRIIHAADLHIDSQVRGIKPELAAHADSDLIVDATRRAFRNLIDWAIIEQVDALVLAGDIFDGNWRATSTREVFMRGVTDLHDSGIPLVFASGNHDAESVLNRELLLPPTARKFSVDRAESIPLLDGGLVVHGQGYANAAEQRNLAADYPEGVPGAVNVGVLHANVGGNTRHGNYAPCSKEDLRRLEYDYVALGHIHKRETFEDAGAVFAAYSGNLQGRTIRETGAKGALLLTLAPGAAPIVEFRELDVLRWEHVEVDATQAVDLASFVEAVEAAHARAFAATGVQQRIARIDATVTPALRERLRAQEEDMNDEVRMRLSDTIVERIKPIARIDAEGSAIDPALLEGLAAAATSLSAPAIAELIKPMRSTAYRQLSTDDRGLFTDDGMRELANRAVEDLISRLGGDE